MNAIDRAAEALNEKLSASIIPVLTPTEQARAVFGSIDTDKLAEVMRRHKPVECSRSGSGETTRWWLCEQCGMESTKGRYLDPMDALRHQAVAVKAHLLDGAS